MHHILAHVPLLLCCLEVIRSQGISAWGKGKGRGRDASYTGSRTSPSLLYGGN